MTDKTATESSKERSIPGPGPGAGARQLAEMFHERYERLAPHFLYETRKATRTFDPASTNGRLMIAVCDEILTWLDLRLTADELVRLRAALAVIADSADFKDFAENEAAWMQGVARQALGPADETREGTPPWIKPVYCEKHPTVERLYGRCSACETDSGT